MGKKKGRKGHKDESCVFSALSWFARPEAWDPKSGTMLVSSHHLHIGKQREALHSLIDLHTPDVVVFVYPYRNLPNVGYSFKKRADTRQSDIAPDPLEYVKYVSGRIAEVPGQKTVIVSDRELLDAVNKVSSFYDGYITYWFSTVHGHIYNAMSNLLKIGKKTTKTNAERYVANAKRQLEELGKFLYAFEDHDIFSIKLMKKTLREVLETASHVYASLPDEVAVGDDGKVLEDWTKRVRDLANALDAQRRSLRSKFGVEEYDKFLKKNLPKTLSDPSYDLSIRRVLGYMYGDDTTHLLIHETRSKYSRSIKLILGKYRKMTKASIPYGDSAKISLAEYQGIEFSRTPIISLDQDGSAILVKDGAVFPLAPPEKGEYVGSFVVVSDIHAGNNDVEATEKVFTNLRGLVEGRNVKAVVDLGDPIEGKAYPNARQRVLSADLSVVGAIQTVLANLSNTIIAVEGNHEKPHNKDDLHPAIDYIVPMFEKYGVSPEDRLKASFEISDLLYDAMYSPDTHSHDINRRLRSILRKYGVEDTFYVYPSVDPNSGGFARFAIKFGSKKIRVSASHYTKARRTGVHDATAILNWAQNLYDKMPDILFAGHTHRPGVVADRDGHYAIRGGTLQDSTPFGRKRGYRSNIPMVLVADVYKNRGGLYVSILPVTESVGNLPSIK